MRRGIFRQMRAGDILLHHPYHNYDTSILRFLESAAPIPVSRHQADDLPNEPAIAHHSGIDRCS